MEVKTYFDFVSIKAEVWRFHMTLNFILIPLCLPDCRLVEMWLVMNY